MISWGSGPAETRARICRVEGSTRATVLSLFASTRSVGEGACANAAITMNVVAMRQQILDMKRVFLRIVSFSFPLPEDIPYSALPAAAPDAHAHWKLNPPRCPV